MLRMELRFCNMLYSARTPQGVDRFRGAQGGEKVMRIKRFGARVRWRPASVTQDVAVATAPDRGEIAAGHGRPRGHETIGRLSAWWKPAMAR
jgi:hypothetical protein